MPSKVVNKLNVPPPVVRRKDLRRGGMALNFGQPPEVAMPWKDCVETKTCTKCKKELTLIQYYLDRGKRKSSCKVCCNAQVKAIAERKRALKVGRSVPLAIEVDSEENTVRRVVPVYTPSLEETNKAWAHVTPYPDNTLPTLLPTNVDVIGALRALFQDEDAAIRNAQSARDLLALAEQDLRDVQGKISDLMCPRGALPSP